MQDLLRELAVRLPAADGQVDVLYALTPVVDGQALSGRLLVRLPHHPVGDERWTGVDWQDMGRLVAQAVARAVWRADFGRRRTHQPAVRRHRRHARPGPPPVPGSGTDPVTPGRVSRSARSHRTSRCGRSWRRRGAARTTGCRRVQATFALHAAGPVPGQEDRPRGRLLSARSRRG